MPGTTKPKKNSLAIRLTESAVFLRTNDNSRRTRNNDSRTSMLRGLLTLDLVKPTRITSIELQLQAKTATAWPEGVGARRIEVTEEHEIFSASTVYFRAGQSETRRAASIGPGVALSNGEAGMDEWDDDPSRPSTPRNYEETSRDDGHLIESGPSARPSRVARRVSADSSFFQRNPISQREDLTLAPIPPYSPFPSTPASPVSERPPLSPTQSSGQLPRVDENSAQALEDFRNSLKAGLQIDRRSQTIAGNFSPPITGSAAPSIRSRPEHSLSLSRRPSIENLSEGEPRPSTSTRSPAVSLADSFRSASEHRERGRKGPRFSLASVSNALMDAMRSNSPITRNFPGSREDEGKTSRSRGRTMEKGKSVATVTGSIHGHGSKERSAFGKIGGILKLDADESKQERDGWKEFKKGTYTYPISFTIPGNSPPTMRCAFGSVVWRLRAIVHRPGTFKSKLIASREVIMIACPTEDDTDDVENIIVERHWDQQLQYLISISGRSFHVGGTVPLTLTMMPLTKMKVHRISVSLEERVDYYTQMRRISRTDPISRIELVSLRGEGKGASPILPVDSDDVNAFKNSPLSVLLGPEDDASEMASNLMGPGPWTIHQELQLPTSCTSLRFTNKNRRSNIVITHVLKCVIRVERGDDTHMDPKTGKRKLFDIVVQAPVQILSCRCNPEWTSLPQYAESFEDPAAVVPSCPCEVRRLASAEDFRANLRTQLSASLERMTSRHSSESSASAVETTPVNPVTMTSLRHTNTDTLLHRNTQFERLVSGQESEIGEAPPAYCDGVILPV